MSSSLLETKLRMPCGRSALVSRPRLVERLNTGLPGQSGSGKPQRCPRKLTLISAPAGFGKTTLVSEWVQAVGGEPPPGEASRSPWPPTDIAWVTLDEGDNDPARFLSYLISALQIAALGQVEGTEANVGNEALKALQSAQPPPVEAVLVSLINELATISATIVLVLDDYHVIEAQAIHDAITFLLEHLPPRMHLVIATRVDPPLPLARLRARGQLTVLRAADLRFSSSETAEFLNRVMELDLSAGDIAALERRTEGWIAGLRLAAISMQGRKDTAGFIDSFTGSHRFVLDYLIEEVLEQQSEDVQVFLLQTAVLDRLTGSLCDAVRFGSGGSADGDGNGQTTLEALEHANLFIIPLDEERRWYRYHRLFTDLLRQRLRQTQPEAVPTLHLRASQWYERNGFADEAIEHALRAEDFTRAAQLMEEQADDLWRRGEHGRLRRWLDRLPPQTVLSRPSLSIFQAWFLFSNGHVEAAERSLPTPEGALGPGTARAAERLRLTGRAAAIRATMDSFRGDVPGIIEHAGRALEYLPEEDLTWRGIAALVLGSAHGLKGDQTAAYQVRLDAWKAFQATGDTYFAIVASLYLAITLRSRGRLQRTTEICRQQVQLAEEVGLWEGSVVGCFLAVWGETLAELNDLDQAVRLAERGLELTERSGDLQTLGWCYLCLVRVLFSRGDYIGAEELTRRMIGIARESDLPPWTTGQMAAWRARLWLAQGKLEAASEWMEERGLALSGEAERFQEIGFFVLSDYLVLTRILIAQERMGEAGTLLQHLLEVAEAGGRTSKVIEILVLLALSFEAQGDTDQAITTLEEALALAEPEGFVRVFVDEGTPMARLLYEAVVRGIAPSYTRRLLGAFPVGEAGQTGSWGDEAPEFDMVEPLSERELEVLQLVAEGLTNREIAARLFLTLNTVKVHTRNIYGKLNVHSRTQAVARSQELGLLPRPSA